MEPGVLKLHCKKIALLSAVTGALLAGAEPVHAQSAAVPDNGTFDVEHVFAGPAAFVTPMAGGLPAGARN